MRSLGAFGLLATVGGVVLLWAAMAGARSFGRRMGWHAAIDVVVCCRFAAEAVIRLAARRMPPPERDRYEKEWLGELDELQRSYEGGPAISLVVFAIRILVRARTTGRAWAERATAARTQKGSADSTPGERSLGRISSYVSVIGARAWVAVRWTGRVTSSCAAWVWKDLDFAVGLILQTGISILVWLMAPTVFPDAVDLVVMILPLVFVLREVWYRRSLRRRR